MLNYPLVMVVTINYLFLKEYQFQSRNSTSQNGFWCCQTWIMPDFDYTAQCIRLNHGIRQCLLLWNYSNRFSFSRFYDEFFKLSFIQLYLFCNNNNILIFSGNKPLIMKPLCGIFMKFLQEKINYCHKFNHDKANFNLAKLNYLRNT